MGKSITPVKLFSLSNPSFTLLIEFVQEFFNKQTAAAKEILKKAFLDNVITTSLTQQQNNKGFLTPGEVKAVLTDKERFAEENIKEVINENWAKNGGDKIYFNDFFVPLARGGGVNENQNIKGTTKVVKKHKETKQKNISRCKSMKEWGDKYFIVDFINHPDIQEKILPHETNGFIYFKINKTKKNGIRNQ